MGGRSVLNQHMRTDAAIGPAPTSVTEFHRTLPGYRATPLRELPEVAAALGLGGLAIKDESDRLGLPAFKVLGASWAVEQALVRWPRASAIVAASAGNHGRAVAHVAADRGRSCRIYLPYGADGERVRAIAAEGADIVLATGGYEVAVAAAEADAARLGAVLIADTASAADALSASWVIDGYATLFREIAVQSLRPVDVLLVPIGVGALAAAAVRWARHESPHTAIVGVEPLTAGCVTASLRAGWLVSVPTPGTAMSGLDCPTPSAVAWPMLRDGLTGTVTVDDDEAHEAMRELAAAGMAIGDCGASTLAGLRRLATDPSCSGLRRAVRLRDGYVVCLGTEGITDPVAYRAAVGSVPGAASSR